MPELKAVDTVTFDIHPVAAHDIQDKKSQMEGSHRRPAAIKCAPRKVNALSFVLAFLYECEICSVFRRRISSREV